MSVTVSANAGEAIARVRRRRASKMRSFDIVIISLCFCIGDFLRVRREELLFDEFWSRLKCPAASRRCAGAPAA